MRSVPTALLAALAVGLAHATPFEVVPSTRQVTCVTELDGRVLAGTTGGLVVTDPETRARRVLLPGVAVRALAGRLVATDRGLFRLGTLEAAPRRLDARATSALFVPEGGFLGSQALLTGHPRGEVRRWRDGAPVETLHFPTRAPIHSVAQHGATVLAASVEGAWSLTGGKVTTEDLGEDPLARSVMTLRLLGDRVLAGTPLGVHERDAEGAWSRLAGREVHVTSFALEPDGSGHVLVTTAGDALHRVEGRRVRPLPWALPHATGAARIGEGLYVGTPRDGLRLYRGIEDGEGEENDPEHLWDLLQEPPGNTITALAHATAFGTLVVGTFDHGLGLYQRGTWRHFGEDRGLPSDWINHVSSDGRRVLVRLSDGRVYTQIERERFRQLGYHDHGYKNWSSAVGTSRGRQWFGTESAFYLRTPTGWDVFAPKPTLAKNLVLDVALTETEAWIATHRNGLYRWDALADSWRSWTLGTGLPDTWVTAVETFRGEVWAGTFDSGVVRLSSDEAARRADPATALDGARWEAPPGELPSSSITCMFATDREVWIGTLEGLVRADGRGMRTFGLEEGLPATNVLSLTSDGRTLWVGTEGGLAHAPLAALR